MTATLLVRPGEWMEVCGLGSGDLGRGSFCLEASLGLGRRESIGLRSSVSLGSLP